MRFCDALLLAAFIFSTALRTRSSEKDFSPTRKATSPSSSGGVHLNSGMDATSTTSGSRNRRRAASNGKGSGTTHLLPLSFRCASTFSMLPCSLISFSAVTGPTPRMASV